MRTVTFDRRYIHPLANGHAEYPAGATLEVSEEVAAKAEKAGRLKADPLDHDGNGRRGGTKAKAD